MKIYSKLLWSFVSIFSFTLTMEISACEIHLPAYVITTNKSSFGNLGHHSKFGDQAKDCSPQDLQTIQDILKKNSGTFSTKYLINKINTQADAEPKIILSSYSSRVIKIQAVSDILKSCNAKVSIKGKFQFRENIENSDISHSIVFSNQEPIIGCPAIPSKSLTKRSNPNYLKITTFREQFRTQVKIPVATTTNREIYVAATTIQAGQSGISLAQVEKKTTEVPIERIPIEGTAKFSSLVAKKNIPAGHPLFLSDFYTRNLVSSGDTIKVKILSGAISIRTTAKCLESGTLDQAVRCQDINTDQKYLVKIVGHKEGIIEL